MAYLANKSVFFSLLGVVVLIIAGGTFFAMNIENSDDAPNSYNQKLQQTTLNAADYTNCGSTFLSIDRIEDQYTDFIRAYVVSNGGGECGKVIFSKEELNQKMDAQNPNPDQLAVSQGATLYIDTQQTAMTYNYQDTMWDYEFLTVGGGQWNLGFCNQQWCEDNGFKPTVGTMRQVSWPGPCWCVYTTKAADIKDIDYIGKLSSRTYFKIDGVGENYVDTSGEGAQKTITLSDKAIIKWVGYKQGDFVISSPGANYRVAQPTSGNAVVINKENEYTPRQMKDSLDKIASYCIYSGSQWWEQIMNIIYPWNIFLSSSMINTCKNYVAEYDTSVNNQLYADQKSKLIYGPVESVDISSSSLKLNLNTMSAQFPEFVVDLDAEWLGIHKIVGKPGVTCPSTLDLQEGKRADSTITIQNLHQEEGGVFDVFVSCGGVVIPTHISRVSLKPGASQTATIQNFASSVSKDTTGKCDVVVRSVNALFGYAPPTASCSYGITVKNVDTCVPSNTKCSTDWKSVMTCNSDGKTETKTDCDYGCKYDSGGKAVCQSVCSKEGQECSLDSDCCFSEKLVCKKGLLNGQCVKNVDPSDYCESCTSWLVSLFQKEEDRCLVKKVFENEDCKWYDLSCNFHNAIVPDWNQKEFCPIIFGMIGLMIGMLVVLVIIILKKKGIIGKGMSYKPKTKNSGVSFAGVGWRGK